MKGQVGGQENEIVFNFSPNPSQPCSKLEPARMLNRDNFQKLDIG